VEIIETAPVIQGTCCHSHIPCSEFVSRKEIVVIKFIRWVFIVLVEISSLSSPMIRRAAYKKSVIFSCFEFYWCGVFVN